MDTYKRQKFLSGGEKTLNNTGYMTGSLDPYSKKFIDFASKTTGKVVDIGACFGIATIAALEAGAQNVIATDNEPRHLEILRQRVKDRYLDKLTCVTGALPNDIHFDKNSISAILCSRILHLLRGDDIDLSLKNMYNWLEPNGRLYLINDTPYAKYSDRFVKELPSIYKKNKQEGIRWPGHIPNMQDFLYPEFRELSPDFITLMDVDTITNACQEHGFKIIKAEYISRPDYPPALQNDGRENVCLIAEKI